MRHLKEQYALPGFDCVTHVAASCFGVVELCILELVTNVKV